MNRKDFPAIKIYLSWLVHVFTASGLIAGFMAILAINTQDWKMVMFWLLIAFFIDGVDGTFARMLDVKKTLPHIDGKMIDTVVDFMNYAVVPAYFIHMAEILPEHWSLLSVAFILLTSAIYYGKEGMILDEQYFVGFPVLWNMVAFFLFFVVRLPSYLNVVLILIFGVLHFVPLKFPYPSRKSRFQKLDMMFSTILFITLIIIGYQYPENNLILSSVALICGGYFMGMAVYNTLKN